MNLLCSNFEFLGQTFRPLSVGSSLLFVVVFVYIFLCLFCIINHIITSHTFVLCVPILLQLLVGIYLNPLLCSLFFLGAACENVCDTNIEAVMKRNANRQTAVSANDGFNPDEKENIKRISLAFNKVGNLLLQLHPLFDHVALLSSLTDKAKTGHFFCKIGYSGDILPADAEQSLISVHGVRWQMIIEELNAGYATSFGMSPEVGTIVLPEEIVDEISYEFERQDLEVQKENKRFLTQKRLSESKGLAQKRLDESKVKTKKLLELNDQPLFPGCWRKEAFAPRVYVEKLQEYKGASCIEPREQRDLQQQLRTSLAGFQGPAYNYDDHDLTERWMNSFEDSTGSIGRCVGI